MQSANADFSVYFRIAETEENLYSNIDPRTGTVVAYEHSREYETDRTTRMNKYSSGLNLSSIESLARRSDIPRSEACGERCKKAFGHMWSLDIVLKYLEIILLGLCLGLFTRKIHDLMETTSTMAGPMIIVAILLTIAVLMTVCLAVKARVSYIFQIVVNTLAVLATAISGGVLLGVWINLPRKVKGVYYWESTDVLLQSVLSFTAAIVYVADLAWSLNSLNRIP